MDFIRLAYEERTDFAAFLKTLTDEQWETPTLCTGWRVRDLVAHVISYEGFSRRELAQRFAKARFIPDRFNALVLAESDAMGPPELLALLNERLEPRGLTSGFGGRIALTDCLIHHQDIRRPLGMPREIPQARLRPVFRMAYFAPPVHGFWHVRGFRMVADDLGWSIGRGPEVHGPAEAVLMTIAGRLPAVHELSGPGRPRLAKRMAG